MFYQIDIIYQCLILLISSIIFSSLIIKLIIKLQTKKEYYLPQREELTFHNQKNKTPLFGGVGILFGSIFSLLLTNYQVFTNLKLLKSILIFIGFFIIGFVDDYLKISKKDYHGVKESVRLFLEIILSFLFLRNIGFQFSSFQVVNFFNNYWHIGILAIIICSFIIVGSSNAMNLTDGLDGLATCLFIICLMPFIIYSFKNKEIELGLFLVSCFASSIGFIIFNIHPSKIFMGDCGSLYLGSILGGISVYLHLEYVLLIAGFVLIIETLSVIIQVIYYKLTHKRVFLMAPLHHHFEMKGFNEEKVVLVFMIIGYFFSFIATLLII